MLNEGQVEGVSDYWSVAAEELLGRLDATADGLTAETARGRLASSSRLVQSRRWVRGLLLLLAQFRSPIILILLAAACVSGALGEATDAAIILAIVVASGLLGFWQEWRASDALEQLLGLVQATAGIARDGQRVDVAIDEVVPGDVAWLRAGDLIPGDGRVLEANALFVSEAALTGETFPVEKQAGTVAPETPAHRRTNCLFLGTNVVSGTAKLLVVATGRTTEFGQVSRSLRLRPPETAFERGIRRFGSLLMEVTLLLVLAIFAINVAFHRPMLESLLFSVAIAVGLTPQLLPAILSVNLSHGARRMARERVIVRRLSAIEDLGGMDVLCADKTGTLTEGNVRLHAALDAQGRPSARVARYAALNARLQAGYPNPIDVAILAATPADLDGSGKLDEQPYDFVRKRLSILVHIEGRNVLISKGALANVLAVCTASEKGPGEVVELERLQPQIDRRFAELSAAGYRTLGVAYRDMGSQTGIAKHDESGMIFLGLLALDDPLRPGIVETLRGLERLGITTKLITGDNRLVAAHVASEAGLGDGRMLVGDDLRHMSDEALVGSAGAIAVFAEVEPNQKERIILALKKSGATVGFMGDGINDASALHAADVGISVDDAVPVAREAADIVLLEKDLGVLERGVREGRITSANTIKYIFMATSANFGNMFSMAGASLFLSYLPLLPKQVLLLNLLTDLPEMAIATDRVDPEMIERPHHWDLSFIRRFMIVFGAISSVFDFLTFGLLLGVLHATERELHTGWFLESVASAALVVLVVRTRRRLFRSRPGRPLSVATFLVVALTVALPFTPLASHLEFTPLPASILFGMGAIVVLYAITAEAVKAVFYRIEASRQATRSRRRAG